MIGRMAPASPRTERLEQLGAMALLVGDTARDAVRRRPSARDVVRQMDALGVGSLGIVTITALFAGMVLALQTANALERYGAKQMVGQVVALSLVREMGPVLTALVIAGRVGAGMTAELGSMAVTEQVDALRALGASPLRRLVAPRLIAILVMGPALTLLADLVGIVGGGVVAMAEVGQPFATYWSSSLSGMELGDVVSGVAKSFFFAGFVGVIGCTNGLSATGGADGVGRATTSTVVAASIAILVSDFFLTKLFLLLP
jgi:phospholipid/cholesterol/gamma-HCH transport system permease protein